jgi:hypothetical protein
MSIHDTLAELFYAREDIELATVYELSHNYYKTFVVLTSADPLIQAVKVPHDIEESSTVIHFNRDCEELSNLLRGWSDVTSIVSN